MHPKVNAEIIAIGDEILFGQITNTNAQYISAQLDKIGVHTIQQTAISDSAEAIQEGLTNALQRADIVLITGGLGPTKDDLTKYTLAQYFNSKLEINEEALAHITHLMVSRGREMNELNRLQALQPTKAKYIKNEVGTAPAMWFNAPDGKVVIAMPGVPFEMKHILEHQILPQIKTMFNTESVIHYYIKTIGIAESALAIKIEDWENSLPQHIKLAYLPSFGQVKMRLTTTNSDQELAKQELKNRAEEILPIISKYLYHTGSDIDFEAIIAELLQQNNLTLAVAESCTGGALSALFTNMAGSSAYFKGGVVAYLRSIKENVLGVPSETITQYGIVSEETAAAMAIGAAKVLDADIAISTTGVAGPSAYDNKPVGTVCIGISFKGEVFTQTFQLMNMRETNIRLACVMALNKLRLILNEKGIGLN
jgi:nicotinamide-nucleotide amidase